MGDFREAKANFVNAARMGMGTGMSWGESTYWAPKLVNNVLLPMAEKGLADACIDSADINKYLGVIQGRCAKGINGSSWQIRNYRKLKDRYGVGKALILLTREMYHRQESGEPVHEWKDVQLPSFKAAHVGELTAAKIMSTDLFTVRESDFITLAANIMDWQNIRHLPVENEKGELSGIITAKNLQKWWGDNGDDYAEVKQMMVKEVYTIDPDTNIDDIRNMMFEYQIGCLPVVVNKKLVGIVTDTDVTKLEFVS